MTQINIRVDELDLSRWKIRAGHIGVSAWLRELANHDCDGVSAKVRGAPKKSVGVIAKKTPLQRYDEKFKSIPD